MKLVLQWHITDKCNFRCKHCYQDEYTQSWPKLDKLKEIFLQYLDIKMNIFWDTISQKNINFIWWEPLLRDDFKDLLSYINKVSPYSLNIWILTNWTLLTNDFISHISKLKKLKIHFQFSLEWPQKINDSIRWEGSYKKVLNAITLCNNHNIKYHLSFTLTKLNYKEIYDLLPLVEKYWIKLKVRRFVPNWNWEQISKYILSAKQWYIFSINIFKINQKLINWKIDLSWCSEVTWYAYSGNNCAINDHRLLVINTNLEVSACKRLEIPLWNLADNSLKELYLSKKYKDLVNSFKEIKKCKSCDLYLKCKWWAKCIAYSINKNLKAPDPQCLKQNFLEK